MASSSIKVKEKYIPGCDDDAEEIFDFPFLKDKDTIDFIRSHGQIMFIVRGPPGTGKSTLSSLLCDRYPDGVVCCADHYFQNSFAKQRSKETLPDSHKYCQKKVNEACVKSSDVIIVQNTHIKKKEMQEYMNFAAEYNYTVIMAITIRKFAVNPEVLEKTNTQGLTKAYFKNRLKQWEEVIPFCTGWFICPNDACYLFCQVQVSLEALLDDGKFCRVLDVYEKDEIQSHYKARKVIFCKSAQNVGSYKMNRYYLSNLVQNSYGKAFTVILTGYIVNKSVVVGVIQVDELMKALVMDQDIVKKEGDDFGAHLLSMLNLNQNDSEHNKVVELNQQFSDSGKTVELINWEDDEELNTKDCRFILLAQDSCTYVDINHVEELSSSLLLQCADDRGYIDNDSYIELAEDVKILRLSDEAWYIQSPQKIKMKSIFTGLYT